MCWLRLWPLVLFIASCSDGTTAVQRYGAPQAKVKWSTSAYVTMLRNTAISVTLADSIDTDVHRTGTEFRATLTQPIVVDLDTVFAVGAGARGILSSVIESGGRRFRAELQFGLTALQNSRGQWIRIGTHTIQERRATSTSKKIILVGGGGIVGGMAGTAPDWYGSAGSGAKPGATTGPDVPSARPRQGIFHGPGTEIVFFSNESTRIALR